MNPTQEVLDNLAALNLSIPELISNYNTLNTELETKTSELDTANSKYAALVAFIDQAYALAHP